MAVISKHPYQKQGSHGCDPPDYGNFCKICGLDEDATYTDTDDRIHPKPATETAHRFLPMEGGEDCRACSGKRDNGLHSETAPASSLVERLKKRVEQMEVNHGELGLRAERAEAMSKAEGAVIAKWEKDLNNLRAALQEIVELVDREGEDASPNYIMNIAQKALDGNNK